MALTDKARVMLNTENSLRITQLFFGVMVVSLTAGWKSKNVTYKELDRGDFDEGGKVFYAILIGFFSLFYLGGALFHTCLRFPKHISPQLDICANTILAILMFVASILLGSSLSNLGDSLAVREAGLSLHVLSAAVVFSLALCSLFAVGTIFAYWENRRQRNNYSFPNTRSMSDLPDDIPT